ncbi:UDP-N-acetylmuramoylalanyl-D-glutamyl-2,6-diaminopimelate--D-alanyl-D-alanyl ligase [Parvibaculum lavamentivorans DS-1]|uniref:UDP-N-acetylmuramoyl-tripeptide--D-alanyl-D-alanine ligase n=1 Tax=Parvibaculum lavamentivorans (strain DS-1 / DSM 13023 / NCIMB 13966) TaxID=402881 RepID=A7HVU3_PARL1|nr:UDP-N-acetylmuramoylalanyl-D-glutamyl-2,6-diaminopimelate--D-alanyl-D-alanine ligase [Parvibaculum lavamentivorans]ABS64026.1 UDP-N-acetylmuramoylalanyl-D-glutamyl-2,6-diaminopimelate--D-alanyl-D-alanyl ligase [Parvibaculum lavamentivorans DS-1]
MSAPLWTKEDVLAATGGKAEGAAWSASGVSIDSRTLEAGDLFVAIIGENSDGHAYVEGALKKGAAAAIVSAPTEAMRAAGPLVIVTDTLAALNALGRAARARTKAKVVAVTGSVGKTGTKEALKLILSEQGATHASAASYNNLWGVPLSLARMPAATRFGIFEVGMNHPGEITPLSKLVEPFVSLITTVEAVHMEFFDSVEQIADAKGEIFDGLQKGGVAILNRDNPHYERLRAKAEKSGAGRIISFGEHEEADARLEKAALKEDCSCVSATICGQKVTYKLAVPGRHIVMNSLAMLACVHALEADLAMAALAMASLKAPKGRGERHIVSAPLGQFTLVDESYNANPVSMRAALDALGRAKPEGNGRRIAVMGDMLEIGETSIEMHRGLADAVREAGIDLVFACGPHMRELYKALPAAAQGAYAETSAELGPLLRDAVEPGDVVMVKGSLGSRMGPLVDLLRGLGDDEGESIRRNRGTN